MTEKLPEKDQGQPDDAGGRVFRDPAPNLEEFRELSPNLRVALRSPVRRRILRVLGDGNGLFRLRDLREQAVGRAGALSAVHYHARVLEGCKAVRSRPAPEYGPCARHYSSLVSADPQVIRYLNLTRQGDGLSDSSRVDRAEGL